MVAFAFTSGTALAGAIDRPASRKEGQIVEPITKSNGFRSLHS